MVGRRTTNTVVASHREATVCRLNNHRQHPAVAEERNAVECLTKDPHVDTSQSIRLTIVPHADWIAYFVARMAPQALTKASHAGEGAVSDDCDAVILLTRVSHVRETAVSAA